MKACFYLCLTWHTKHTELNIIAVFYTFKLKLLEAKDIFLHKWAIYNFLFCLSVIHFPSLSDRPIESISLGMLLFSTW